MDDTTRFAHLWARIVKEWPAALAIFVLVIGHLYMLLIAQTDLQPLGLPLFLAIGVFVLAELFRRLR